MNNPHIYECSCGKTHTAPQPVTPPGWLIGRDGKPVCDDCAAAARTRRRRVAA